MTPPENRFRAAPAHHAPATPPARVVGGVAPPPVLSVRASGEVTLSKALLQAIPHLKTGAPVDVVPPQRRGGTWYLDTRATAPRRVQWSKAARFRIAPLSREHLLTLAASPPGTFGGAQGVAGTRAALAFALGPALPGHAGYFALHPL